MKKCISFSKFVQMKFEMLMIKNRFFSSDFGFINEMLYKNSASTFQLQVLDLQQTV